jgi:hypothetical protein
LQRGPSRVSSSNAWGRCADDPATPLHWITCRMGRGSVEHRAGIVHLKPAFKEVKLNRGGPTGWRSFGGLFHLRRSNRLPTGQMILDIVGDLFADGRQLKHLVFDDGIVGPLGKLPIHHRLVA